MWVLYHLSKFLAVFKERFEVMDSEGKIDHDKKGVVAGIVMWQQELVGELADHK